MLAIHMQANITDSSFCAPVKWTIIPTIPLKNMRFLANGSDTKIADTVPLTTAQKDNR